MRPLIDSSHTAFWLYWSVVIVWVGFEASYSTRLTGRGNPRQDRLSGPALLGGVLLSVWLGSALARVVPQAAITVARPELFGAGIALAFSGVALRWYAVRVLGRFFTVRVTTTVDQVVVENGPYRFVRHPSYSGLLLTLFGVLLCSTNWLALLCFAIAIPGFAYRIAVEERALLGALGEPYRAYMKRTRRLVPFLV